MNYASYVDYFDKPLSLEQVKCQRNKSNVISLYVTWRKIPKIYFHPSEMNKILEGLDCKAIKPNKDFKTITALNQIKNTYFKVNNNRTDRIEICVCQKIEDKYKLFRISNHKAEDGFTGLDAWNGLNKAHGKKIDIKSLPQELHKFRICCPKPIDWLNPVYKEKIRSGITKADISSAYGYQLTKILPDLEKYELVEGFAEPSVDWPFVFYLKSNNMAVYDEGNTYNWESNRYAEAGRRGRLYDIPKEEEISLRFQAKDYGLRDTISKLYAQRNENPINKQIMNLSVGFLDQKEYYPGQIVAWPIRAVIIYRCNEVILDICRRVIDRGGIPVLINTDSVSWIGEEFGITEAKGLGKFTLEYENAEFCGVGPKCYQIKSGDEILTRYSGPHRKEFLSTLSFGDILKDDVLQYIKELENNAMYTWDNTRMRFITKAGGLL